MSVSNKVILEKMATEMTKAKKDYADRESYLRRIANIKLLCELLLDESSEEAKHVAETKPTAAEIKQMMGKTDTSHSEELEQNPKSIFDF